MNIIALLGGIRATIFAAIAVAALILAGKLAWELDTAADTITSMTTKQLEDAAALAAAQTIASEEARLKEYVARQAVDDVAEAYEKGKQDAQESGEAVVADLRAGAVQLRERWQGCEARRLPAPGGTTAFAHAEADDRSESAGRIVAAAAACDAQVIGLQDYIRTQFITPKEAKP